MDKLVLTAKEAIYSRFGVPIDFFKENPEYVENIKLQSKIFEGKVKLIVEQNNKNDLL